jgi:hypothetical protein
MIVIMYVDLGDYHNQIWLILETEFLFNGFLN